MQRSGAYNALLMDSTQAWLVESSGVRSRIGKLRPQTQDDDDSGRHVILCTEFLPDACHKVTKVELFASKYCRETTGQMRCQDREPHMTLPKRKTNRQLIRNELAHSQIVNP